MSPAETRISYSVLKGLTPQSEDLDDISPKKLDLEEEILTNLVLATIGSW